MFVSHSPSPAKKNVTERRTSENKVFKNNTFGGIGAGGRVNTFGHIGKSIELIKNKLSNVHLQKFKRSCFGKFLSVSEELEIHPTLLHQLVRRQVNPNLSDDAIIFRICQNEVIFSVVDFALITGLKCHEEKEVEVLTSERSGGVRERFFPGMKGIKRTDLEVVLNAQNPVDDEEDLGILQLCLIYFLSNVLLSSNKCNLISDAYFDLVDNIDNFNMYAWGLISWFETRDSILHAGSAIIASEKSGKDPHYNLYGFPLALQIWSYEIIPLLAARFALPRGVKTPRVCAWKTVTKPVARVLADQVFNNTKLEIRTIAPSEEELRDFAIKKVYDEKQQLSRVLEESFIHHKKKRKGIIDREEREDKRINPYDPTSVSTVDGILDALKKEVLQERKLNSEFREYVMKEIRSLIFSIQSFKANYAVLANNVRLRLGKGFGFKFPGYNSEEVKGEEEEENVHNEIKNLQYFVEEVEKEGRKQKNEDEENVDNNDTLLSICELLFA